MRRGSVLKFVRLKTDLFSAWRFSFWYKWVEFKTLRQQMMHLVTEIRVKPVYPSVRRTTPKFLDGFPRGRALADPAFPGPGDRPKSVPTHRNVTGGCGLLKYIAPKLNRHCLQKYWFWSSGTILVSSWTSFLHQKRRRRFTENTLKSIMFAYRLLSLV